ncbi:MAG: class I SAM-dependent methyltransferase [Rhodocyclales bacterium]|nr:class I SAM-dependent methyltransferase [Rhodocyclales bacterium]
MDSEVHLRMARDQGVLWWFVARRAILRKLIGTSVPNTATILEIGCGTGGNLPMLAEFGQVCGIESDPTARAIAASQQPKIEILSGALPDALPLGNRKFDLICLLDVLEHVEADGNALRVSRSHLAPGGRLILTVPAYQWMYGPHDVVHHHFRRYNARSVRRLAEASAFKVRYVGYFNTLVFPIAAPLRLAERLFPVLHASDSMPPPPINRLLKLAFGLERFVLPHLPMPFGLSVMAILENP